MAGTPEGGTKAYYTNVKDEPGFYKRIGQLGGSKSRTGGFAAGEAGRQRARLYGTLGGRIGRRSDKKLTPEQKRRIKNRWLKQYDDILKRLTDVHEAAKGDTQS